MTLPTPPENFRPPWTPEAEDAAVEACKLFAGTRHMQRRCVPGRGVDCVQFVAAVLRAAGMLPEFTWPTYRQDTGFHLPRNVMEDHFCEVLACERLDPAAWQPATGDVGIFRVGPVSNHVGIVVAGRFWHVTTSSPVHHQAPAVVARRLQSVLRLTAAGLRGDPSTLLTT